MAGAYSQLETGAVKHFTAPVFTMLVVEYTNSMMHYVCTAVVCAVSCIVQVSDFRSVASRTWGI